MERYTVRLTYEVELEATHIEMAVGGARSQIERYHTDKPHPPIVEAAVERLYIHPAVMADVTDQYRGGS